MALTLSGNPNILSKISFCDKECSNINDNKTKSLIVELLDKNHKVQIISKDYMILKLISNLISQLDYKWQYQFKKMIQYQNHNDFKF